jgi:ribosomal protein S11
MAEIAIFRINYKSDFILTLNSDAGWMTPFCIKFWTGAPNKAYFVGYDGTNYQNCRMGETSDKLVVLFDDHNLPIGDLQMQIAYHTTIEEFPTVQFDEVTNPVMVKTEIDGQEYHVMLDFTGETAPEIEFSLPAYYNEQQRIANEQERERIFAEMQRESGAATAGAENINATLNGTTLTVTDRTGHQTSSNVQGPPGPPGSGVQADWSETNPSADDYIKNKPTVYTQQQVDQKLAEKQNVITDLQTIRDNAADGKQALTDVTAVEQLIPAAATSQNKLADQGFVNSSVATNTAYYISDNGEPFTSLEALEAYSGPLTNNDFAFVVGTDSAGNTTYTRYKYNADTEQWAEEFVLNNSSFTAAQWAAIQSGITAALVGKLSDLPTNSELTALLAGKQDTISDLSTIRSGAQAGATAYQKPQAGIPVSDLALGMDNVPTSGSDNFVKSGGVYSALQGKQDVIDSSHKLSADLVDDTNTTNKFTNATEKQTWNNKQDALVSGTNIKTVNNESILGGGNITIQGGGSAYVPTLNAAPTSSTTTYTKDGQTLPFEIGQFCRVPKTGGGYNFYQLYDLVTESNVTTATWEQVGELPSNVAYISSDSGVGIVPEDGIRAETVTSAATISVNPDVVTVIDGAVGTAAITLQVPDDNLAHVWDILLTTDSSVAITFAMSNSATILYPNGFSVGASKAVEISVIGIGTKYYLRYGEFA